MAGRMVASLATQRFHIRPLFFSVLRDLNLIRVPVRFSTQPRESGLLPGAGQELLAEHQNPELKTNKQTNSNLGRKTLLNLITS